MADLMGAVEMAEFVEAWQKLKGHSWVKFGNAAMARIAALEADLTDERATSKRWCEAAMYVSERCEQRDLWAKAWKVAAKDQRDVADHMSMIIADFIDAP